MKKTLIMMAAEAQPYYSSLIVAAKINGEVRDIQTVYDDTDEIQFIELDTSLGWSIYRRSVLFLLIIAVNKIEHEAEVIAKFTVNKGLYCEIKTSGKDIDANFIDKVKYQYTPSYLILILL